MEELRYPVGRFEQPGAASAADRRVWANEIASLPKRLRDALAGISAVELDTLYRPEGWTVRQVVHHIADSHMNAFIRFRLALTEDNPTIKPYAEAAWAELPDARSGEVGPSLDIIEGLHSRWVVMAEAMPDEAWSRSFYHPERKVALRLDTALAMYAWHSRHHLAHVTGTLARLRS
jgi:hypothetical protein